jgi:sarcosine oxidase, subunit beta
MGKSAAVIVVGAGVTGLSAAYHLARRKAGRIVLIDKGPVGDGSSSRAAGIITGHLWTEAGIRVRKRCLELYRELSQELNGYKFQQPGCLNLFSKETWPERAALIPQYDRLGVPYEILNAAAITERWPEIHPRPDETGLFDPLGGYSEGSEYIPALRRRVEEMGVEIRENEMVNGFDVRSGRVVGVRVAAGVIAASTVVSTVYSWTRLLLATIGITLPVKCFVHQRYVTVPLAQPFQAIPAVNANPYMSYFRPALGNRLLAGIETADREEFVMDGPRFQMSAVTAAPELPAELRRRLLPLLPALETVEWESAKVGLLTFSMDGEPILGPIAAFPGLVVGLAFHSGGFAYNPGTGELLAEYVTEGKTGIDVTSWSPDRFDPAETAAYMNATIRQKDVARRRH